MFLMPIFWPTLYISVYSTIFDVWLECRLCRGLGHSLLLKAFSCALSPCARRAAHSSKCSRAQDTWRDVFSWAFKKS